MSAAVGGSASHSSSKNKTQGGSRTFLSPTSTALRGINLDFARQVLAELQKTSGLAGQIQDIPGLVGGFSSDLTSLNQPDQALQDILNGKGPTPEQRQAIQDAADAAIASGTSDINNQLGISLGLVRNELGPGLGLRPGDTPLIDRGNVLARESARQVGQLVTNVRGQQAQNLLNYPLEMSPVAQAQAQLRSQAFANRLALTGQGGQLGLGLATAYNPAQGLQVSGSFDPHSYVQKSKTLGESQGASASLGASI